MTGCDKEPQLSFNAIEAAPHEKSSGITDVLRERDLPCSRFLGQIEFRASTAAPRDLPVDKLICAEPSTNHPDV